MIIIKSTIFCSILFILTCGNSIKAFTTDIPQNKYLLNLKNKKELKIGVYIYKKTLERYFEQEKKLVENCKKIGITEVYLSFSNQYFENNKKTYTLILRNILKLFNEQNIDVYALTIDTPTLLFNHKRVKEIIKNIVKYNHSSPPMAQFTGISTDIEPHMLKEKYKQHFGQYEIYWSKDGYGKGGSNDKLLKNMLSTLKIIKENDSNLPLSQAVANFYFRRYTNGELTYGSPSDYLKAGCNIILLMVYHNKYLKITKKAEPFLKHTRIPRAVMITVKTSINTSGGGGEKTTLAKQSWKEFRQGLQLIISNLDKYKSFRGIAFFEYEGLENIWKTQD